MCRQILMGRCKADVAGALQGILGYDLLVHETAIRILEDLKLVLLQEGVDGSCLGAKRDPSELLLQDFFRETLRASPQNLSPNLFQLRVGFEIRDMNLIVLPAQLEDVGLSCHSAEPSRPRPGGCPLPSLSAY